MRCMVAELSCLLLASAGPQQPGSLLLWTDLEAPGCCGSAHLGVSCLMLPTALAPAPPAHQAAPATLAASHSSSCPQRLLMAYLGSSQMVTGRGGGCRTPISIPLSLNGLESHSQTDSCQVCVSQLLLLGPVKYKPSAWFLHSFNHSFIHQQGLLQPAWYP